MSVRPLHKHGGNYFVCDAPGCPKTAAVDSPIAPSGWSVLIGFEGAEKALHACSIDCSNHLKQIHKRK